MEMNVKPFLQTTPGLLVQFFGGILMVLMGARVLPLYSTTTTPAASPTTSTSTTSSFEPKPASYRLAYDPQQGAWIVSPQGGDPELLTDLVPNPRKVRVPSGYLSLEQVRSTLLEVFKTSGAWPDAEDRALLLKKQLDGHPLFRAEDLKTGKAR